MKNGENLLLIRDRRIAVSYMVEALRIFDHYHFRVAQEEASRRRRRSSCSPSRRASPARSRGGTEDYTDRRKIRDRELFA